MTRETALKVLGLTDTVGMKFQDIVNVKNLLIEEFGGDEEHRKRIESAYDLLLMESLSKRFSGEVADTSVKYADVSKTRALPKALNKINFLDVEVKQGAEYGDKASLIYAGLGAWVLLGALAQPVTELSIPGSDVPGLQLAVGVGASVYFLRDGRAMSLPRAFILTSLGLVGGAVAMGLVEGLVRIDQHPLFTFNSPAALVSEGALAGMWYACSFLY